jgi:tRNA pseudouridine55 synthase
MDFKSGTILSFDKPLEWTSFGLVNKVRYLLCKHIGEKKLKVGHAGTLDPLATGVLIICTGKATKQIDTLQAKTKEYVATLQLGATTPSFDLETEVDATYPTAHITEEKMKEALTRFIGRIEQVPPSYSACKVDGKRAYDLARQGKEVELRAKVLVIDEIELQDFNPTTMQATIRVVCSKGTYIRALARDIGLSLNSGAHLTALRRTRIGDYKVEDCHTLETFQLWLETLPKETEK